MTSEYPELYGDAQNGKTKMWKIAVFDRNGTGVIQTTFGYVDGKKQVNEKVISVGKNIGKKNETTPLEQAKNEARTAWVKKKESGYAPHAIVVPSVKMDESFEEEEEVSATEGGRGKGIDESVPNPMLAHDYNKRGKSIQFPCYVQRKFDGTRCVGIPQKGLFSRNRKAYPHLEHIVRELNQLRSEFVLDGELYSDTLTFQEIVGLVKRETLKKGDEELQTKIKYHIYDLINDKPYHLRLKMLQALFTQYKFQQLILVKTDECVSEDHMKELHGQYVAEGYEGIMLRNKNGLYKNVRSSDLQKFKSFYDEEFQIINFKEGEGLEKGCVIWVCQTENGQIFNCRPRGSREDRMKLFENGQKYIGKQLTVRAQELTNEGIPRFPVGISIRDYE